MGGGGKTFCGLGEWDPPFPNYTFEIGPFPTYYTSETLPKFECESELKIYMPAPLIETDYFQG